MARLKAEFLIRFRQFPFLAVLEVLAVTMATSIGALLLISDLMGW